MLQTTIFGQAQPQLAGRRAGCITDVWLSKVNVEGTVQWKKLDEQIYGEPIYKQLLRSRKAETR